MSQDTRNYPAHGSGGFLVWGTAATSGGAGEFSRGASHMPAPRVRAFDVRWGTGAGLQSSMRQDLSSVEVEDPRVQKEPLLQRRAQGAVQAVLQVQLAAPPHHVREQVAIE